MREINYIIIHHSFTKDSETLSWDDIRRYHIEHNKWSDIGYHYGIELVADSYEILVGRPLSRGGAHCQGDRNRDSVGVCCVGNYDSRKPSTDMLKRLITLIKDLRIVFDIPKENVKGHNIYSSKTCPGKMFDMDGLRKLL